MTLRLVLILLVVALAVNIEKSSAGVAISDDGWGISGRHVEGSCHSNGTGFLVGECIGEEDEFGLESESTRRSLYVRRGRAKYISYRALEANRIPCGQRGRSYYNCYRMGRANPYNRGCTVATRCARDTH